MKCVECQEREAAKNRKVCWKCQYAKLKARDPIGLAYRRLKGHAKERGKEFSITLEEFTQFCVRSDYINKKGIRHDSFHIDRKDEEKGYFIGNIQLLTNKENVLKYIEFVRLNEDMTKVFKTRKKLTENDITIDEETPF